MEEPPLLMSVNMGGELGVLRVRKHPLSIQVHPLIAKITPLKIEIKEKFIDHPLIGKIGYPLKIEIKQKFIKHLEILRSNKNTSI